MDKNIESQLYDLMNTNEKKFAELLERAASNFKEKFKKEIPLKSRDRLHILDGSTPSDYFTSLEILEDWIDKCIDDVRNSIKPFSYPLFVHLYLDLIRKGFWNEGNLKFIRINLLHMMNFFYLFFKFVI